MAVEESLQLPPYQIFSENVSVLALPISVSELHGLMCGYLCAGAVTSGETYLRALTVNKKDDAIRNAARAMFNVYSISQQQLIHLSFAFQMLLPDEHESLKYRALAFSEWCEGFTQAITLAGIRITHLQEEEAQEALQHIVEFAQLDCDALKMGEEDEKALMEVTEYTRMAVLRLYGDLAYGESGFGSSGTAH